MSTYRKRFFVSIFIKFTISAAFAWLWLMPILVYRPKGLIFWAAWMAPYLIATMLFQIYVTNPIERDLNQWADDGSNQ